MLRAVPAVVLLTTSLTASAASWRYSASVDEMTGKAVHFAGIESTNGLSLAFPYEGRNRAQLIARRSAKGDHVVVQIDKGQLVCSYADCAVQVRFDQGEAETYEASRPSDRRATALFINDSEQFLARAKDAREIRVQVVIYQNGNQVLRFKSDRPLQWPPAEK